ncbi:MAG: hypothetical protein HOH03_08945, partial [Candidatus Marinimicrobia bacterium]|nr:hypothetical protein [Candidatus Neomarinimicrobiota bacterium]
MAVQLITNKIIKKYDTNHPNYKPEPIKVNEVDGNIDENYVKLDDSEPDIYGENTHQIQTESNGNLKMEQMMSKMMGKLDNLDNTKSQIGAEVIEVDVQREIAISMVDQNAVKSEVTFGRVKNNKNKLKRFRRRNV